MCNRNKATVVIIVNLDRNTPLGESEEMKVTKNMARRRPGENALEGPLISIPAAR